MGDATLFDAGPPMGSAEFKEFVRKIFDERHPGETDEDLICRPDDAAHFCRLVRYYLQAPKVGDYTILRSLQNLRKRGVAPFKKPVRRIKLEAELRAAGCDADPAMFCDTIADVFSQEYRDKTDEDVLCRPAEAKKLCNQVRRRFAKTAIPDFLILHTVITLRKRGGLKRAAPVAASVN